MISARDGAQIEQRYRELHAEIAGLRTENERLQKSLDKLLYDAQCNGFIGEDLDDAIAWAVRQMGESYRLRRDLNRMTRIAGKADRMYDSIRLLSKSDQFSDLLRRIDAASVAADNYDLALSDTQAEAADGPAVCRRCQSEIDSGHDRG